MENPQGPPVSLPSLTGPYPSQSRSPPTPVLQLPGDIRLVPPTVTVRPSVTSPSTYRRPPVRPHVPSVSPPNSYVLGPASSPLPSVVPEPAPVGRKDG